MKKDMPLEGLRWSRDSGSTLCDTPQNGRSRTGWGGWTLDGDFRWQAISHQFCLYHQLGTSHIALPYPPGMRLRFIPYHAT